MNDNFSALERSITILDRLMKMYLTEKAIPAAKRIKDIHNSFYRTLCSGISAPDILLTEQTLDIMMKNINQKVWHRM